MKRTQKVAPNWNPYQTFVWTKQQIESWIDTYGIIQGGAQYDGYVWDIKTRKIFGNRYNVKFTNRDNNFVV